MTLDVSTVTLKTENEARGKPASQSGSRFPHSTADKAVDGNTNPDGEENTYAHAGTLHIRKYVMK